MPARTWLCLGLLAAVLWLFQKAKGLFWVFSLLVLPGTFCHEVCHYATALVLNGRPVAFSVYPRREENRIQLGAVMMANLRWYNSFFIGMAPLALLPGAWLLLHWTLGHRFPLGLPLVLLVFLVANLACGSIPSGQDFRIAARSPVGWVLVALCMVYGWTHFRVEDGMLRPSRATVRTWPGWRKPCADLERVLSRGARRAKALAGRMQDEWAAWAEKASHG